MNGSDPPRVLTLPPTPLASRPSFELKNPCRFPNATLLSSLCGGGSNSISDVIEKGTDLQNTTSSAVAPYAPSTLSTLSSSPLSPAAPSSPAYPLYEDYYEYEHYNFTDEQWGVVRQLNLYYVPLLIVVGFVGNLLSCVVFLNTRLRMRSSSYYLAALAVADVTYLFILFLVWLDLLGFNTFNVNVMCQLEIYLGSVSSSLSVWLTVAFTVERFIAVQYPLQRPTVCTVHRAKTVILTLTGFSVTVHLYVFVTAGVIVHHDEGGVPITECNLRMDYRGLMNVINWVDTLLTLVVPFIMIVVMNTLIARQLIRFSKRYRNRDDVFHLQEVNGGQANGHKSGGTSSHSHSGRGGAGPCHSASSGTGRGEDPDSRPPPPPPPPLKTTTT
ncbi:neuromedin-U receptor 1-like [Scylla paramamosain]|uniref:neuromedin-U receptor 1-like n=1 Tax=Scylla paramamosain TaxID=85552 RepID=UPI0030832391